MKMNEPVEKSFPPGWFGDGWEYTFQVSQPVNQDAHVLKVLRWRGERNEDGSVDDPEQEYLSRDGWVPYSGYDMMRDPITMTGMRYMAEHRITNKIIDAMVTAMGIERKAAVHE